MPLDGTPTDDTVGTMPSAKTPVVLAILFKVSVALFPAASLSVPPLAVMEDPTVTPSLSELPLTTVYRNTNAVVPDPLR